MLCSFLPLCLTAVQQPGILFFLQYLHSSSSPHCWLRYFVEKSSTAFRPLNHLRHLVLMHYLHFAFSSFFLMCSSHSYHCCMVSSHPVWVHAFSQSFASVSATHQWLLASMLPFSGLIFFSKQEENSCPSIFSSLSYSVFLASPQYFQFQWVASAFEGPFLALFDFVLVEDFLFHPFRQILPA